MNDLSQSQPVSPANVQESPKTSSNANEIPATTLKNKNLFWGIGFYDVA